MKYAWVVALFLGLLADPSPAQAQPATPDQQPNRPMNADPLAARLRDGAWGLIVSGLQSYDSDPLKGAGQTGDVFTLVGPSTGGSVHLSGSKSWRKAGFWLDAGNTTVYYPRSDAILSDSNAVFSEYRKFGRNTTIAAGQSVNFSPYYSIGIFPGLGSFSGTDIPAPFVPTFGSGIQATRTHRFSVSTQLTHQIGERSSIQASYAIQGTGVPQIHSFAFMNEAGGRVTRQLTRSVGLHAGYGFGQTQFGGEKSAVQHNIDVGLDLKRALSLTRRTTFRFTTGTTALRVRGATGGATGSRTEFALLGGASLSHYMGRTWVASVDYNRGWRLLDGLLEPYFSDGVTAVVGGRLNSRSTVGLSAAWVSGVPLVGAQQTRDHATIEGAWYQVQVARGVTAYAQYSYYSQRFAFDGLSSLDLPQRFSRNTARVGMTLLLPRNTQ